MGMMNCQDCGMEVERASNFQKYCKPCSRARSKTIQVISNRIYRQSIKYKTRPKPSISTIILCQMCEVVVERTGRRQKYCKPCAVLKRKRSRKPSTWAQNNPEKHKANARAWAQNNPEKRKIITRAWVQNNPEKRKESTKTYRQKPEVKMMELVYSQRPKQRAYQKIQRMLRDSPLTPATLPAEVKPIIMEAALTSVKLRLAGKEKGK